MKKIILNHKSYLGYNETIKYIEEIKKIKQKDVELIIYPSVPFIALYKDIKNIGAQNFYSYNYGSYTGEINLESLKSMNINYTLIGHSERKKYKLDNYEQIKDKLFKSVNAGFETILCVGELEYIKKPIKYIYKELNYLIKSIDYEKLKKLKIAYEPSWAIGSGETPEINEIEKIIANIKKYFEKKYEIQIEVFYGGSVDETNIKEILKVSDGVLIGKKSTNIEELKKIINQISQNT